MCHVLGKGAMSEVGSISSELIIFGGGERSIVLLSGSNL